MRYHYIPVRMAKILSINTTKCWQGCGETGTLFIAVKRMKNGTETLEESLAVSYKSKHTLIIQFSNRSWYFHKGVENVCTQKSSAHGHLLQHC